MGSSVTWAGSSRHGPTCCALVEACNIITTAVRRRTGGLIQVIIQVPTRVAHGAMLQHTYLLNVTDQSDAYDVVWLVRLTVLVVVYCTVY